MISAFRTTALAAAALGALGGAARANMVSDFSGTCSVRCSGTATGVLTLNNAYVPGTDITTAHFVSFSYTSSDLSFTIPNALGISLTGGLNANGTVNATGKLVIRAAGRTPAIFQALPGVATPPGGNIPTSDTGSDGLVRREANDRGD